MENRQITEQEFIVDQLSRELSNLKILNSKLQFQNLALSQQLQQLQEKSKNEDTKKEGVK